MRYEGSMQVMGFVQVVIDEPGLTIEEAKARVEANPDQYSISSVESMVYEGWEEDLQKTEEDVIDEYGEDED